jgi:uncharacterized protein (DUF58 family)
MTAFPARSFAASDLGAAAFPQPVARRYHRHVPGIIFIGATLVVAVGAINSQNNLLFVALGLCLGALLVSGLISGAALMGVRIERRLLSLAGGSGGARAVDAWRPVHIGYAVHNVNRYFPAMGLVIEELLPPSSRPPRGQGASGSSLWRFRWTTDEPMGAGSLAGERRFSQGMARGFVANVSGRASTSVHVPVMFVRRGRFDLDALTVQTTFPFGLTRKSALFRQPESILVRPAAFELKGGVIEGLLSKGRRGEQRSDRLGPGLDVLSVREHRPGDPYKQIAWKPSARSEQLIVRQTASPAPRQAWVVLRLDAAASAVANETAIALASSFIHALAEQDLAVGLVTIGGTPLHAKPRSGKAHAERLRTDLALVSPDPASPTTSVMPPRPHGAPLAHTREGLVLAIHAGRLESHAVPDAEAHWTGEDLPKLTDADARVVQAMHAGAVLA